MRQVRAIVLNVVRASARNRTALVFTIGLAFFFMLIFGVVFGGKGPSVSVGVVDEDGSALSHDYLQTLGRIDGLHVETGSLDDERSRMRSDKISYLVVVGPGFEAEARSTGRASLTVYPNNDSEQTSSLAANVVSNVTAGFARAQSIGGGGGITLTSQSIQTNDITAVDVLLPSMVAYLVLQSGINFVAITLVDQRQRKVLRRFLATPIRPVQVLAGNVVGGAATVLLQIAVLVLAGVVLFHAKNHGNPLLALLVVLVGTAAFVSIGFLVTSAARTSEAARGICAAIAFPMLFLSGVFIPLDALPQTMQDVVHALPLTYLTEALKGIVNDGDGLTRTILIDIAVLAAWAVGCFTLAAARFRWE